VALPRCGELKTLFLGREDALDLQNVIDVVPGHHMQDSLEAFFAALRVQAEMLPLLGTE